MLEASAPAAEEAAGLAEEASSEEDNEGEEAEEEAPAGMGGFVQFRSWRLGALVVEAHRMGMWDVPGPHAPLRTFDRGLSPYRIHPAGYKSEGTRHLAGWTNFQAAEADVPDMLIPEEE